MGKVVVVAQNPVAIRLFLEHLHAKLQPRLQHNITQDYFFLLLESPKVVDLFLFVLLACAPAAELPSCRRIQSRSSTPRRTAQTSAADVGISVNMAR